MTIERLQVYKCEICGNIVEILHPGKPALVCCNKPMDLMLENSVDAAQEKHVPIVEKNGSTVRVRVGDTAHPMEEKHFIQWIEVIANDTTHITFLKPGDPPEASFDVDLDAALRVRAYCNLHGLWKA